MTHIFRKIVISALGYTFMAGSGFAFAEDVERQFSTQSGELVNNTLQFAETGQIQMALDSLEHAIALFDLKPYERSTIYQMMGQYSYELERPKDAQAAFENAIKAGGLLPEEAKNLEAVIAQLMIGNGQFRDGAEALEAYLSSGGNEKPQYIDLLVNAWVQAEDYQRALPWAEKWYETAEPKMRKHYDLMNFLYNNLGLDGRQADVVVSTDE